jgi:hypothetical protein
MPPEIAGEAVKHGIQTDRRGRLATFLLSEKSLYNAPGRVPDRWLGSRIRMPSLCLRLTGHPARPILHHDSAGHALALCLDGQGFRDSRLVQGGHGCAHMDEVGRADRAGRAASFAPGKGRAPHLRPQQLQNRGARPMTEPPPDAVETP